MSRAESSHMSDVEVSVLEGVPTGHSKRKGTPLATKAGLTFPAGRMLTHIRRLTGAQRVAKNTAIYTAAVVEYLTAELLDIACTEAGQDKKHPKRITPRHIKLAIDKDKDMGRLVGDTVISQGGVLPYVDMALLPKKARERLQNANVVALAAAAAAASASAAVDDDDDEDEDADESEEGSDADADAEPERVVDDDDADDDVDGVKGEDGEEEE